MERPKKEKPKRPTSEQIKLKEMEEPVMEEEKCNSEQEIYSSSLSSYDYYNDEFDSYSSGSEDVHPDEDVELEFSETFPDPLNKVRKELESINKLVQQAQGDIENLPLFGDSIP